MSQFGSRDRDTQTPGRADAARDVGGSAGGGSRPDLRGMTYAEGVAALAPVQLKEDGAPAAGAGSEGPASAAAGAGSKGPVSAAAIQITGKEWDKEHYTWHETVLISRGAAHGVKPGTLVTAAGGAYRGRIAKVFPHRANAKFYGGFAPGARRVSIHPGQTWTKGKWIARQRAGKERAEKAGSTEHTERERGGE
ncbi:MAG: hypothetical protein CVU56_08675 [Deltaproteobacteria bacterium HGW-Deltaproteobacteria-14]|jgi:hypothetical protein|nr:MAG: hypothetical protein CVU56_08675 [Deltaproteobacteria bacterium HGW-Deltaproteobacteria-14]